MKAKSFSSFILHRSPFPVVAPLLVLAGALVLPTSPAAAETIAYWRFEDGPADAQVTHGGQPAGAFYPGTGDSSVYGNALSVWAEGWGGYAYRTDRAVSIIPATSAANNFSVQNTGNYPVLFTDPGSFMQTLTPAAFTIEVSFKPAIGDYRTLVGRDSYGAYAGDPNLAALYLQITPENAVAIKFCDVAGYWHEAISASGIIQGFDRSFDPNGLTGHWYHMAAVSDGYTLWLYLDSGSGFELVAQTDMMLSGSPATALAAGQGSGSDWVAGTWTVGRGLYAGAHTHRAFGFIDEVRISDSALSPHEFLFAPTPPALVEDTTPDYQAVNPGQPASFHASFTGYPVVSYQWEISKDGGNTYTDVPGATNTDLLLNSVQPSDTGLYRLRAWNSIGYNRSTPASLVLLNTIAWWRFEETLANAQVTHGGQPAGVFFPGALDSSGRGNHLSVWAEGWAGYAYRMNTPRSVIPATGTANNLSVQNTGEYPCMFTQTNSAMQTMTPAAFTIEVSFKPESGGWRTLVGRDSQGTSWNPDLPALYLQITPQDAVAIKFCDVSGYWHEAISAPGIVQGFDPATDPYGWTGYWYHLAAVSDGATLSLYLHSGVGYHLVAQTDLTLSGSPNTALTAGQGSGSGWVAGTWSVGRGLYAGTHTDRAYGFIDEVRISDIALAPEQFLFCPLRILVTNTADSGPGSLREALASALDGDTVDATGVAGTVTLTSGELFVYWSVTILGPGPETLTVSGNHGSRVFNVTGTNVVMSGLTIANGFSDFDGGGIYVNSGVTMTISNCTFSGNLAYSQGGAIFNAASSGSATLTINASTFSGNSAYYYGGGIYNDGSSGSARLTINACTFSGNSAEEYHGGGICNDGSSGSATLTINACTFSGNSADHSGGGGGIYNFGYSGNATLTINASTFSGNSAYYGGGICNFGYSGNATLMINASTFSGNSADGGCGIYIYCGELALGDTILNAGDCDANVYSDGGFVVSAGYNLSSDDGGGFLTNVTDVVNTVPLLGPLQDNGGPTWTHALLPGSPAIDAGDDSVLSWLATDQRGLPRKVGAHVDIGAYEVQLPDVTPPWLTGPSRSVDGALQFSFTNAPGAQFTVLAATNLALPLGNWTVLPAHWLIESPAGFYQFTDSSATNDAQRYYRVHWP